MSVKKSYDEEELNLSAQSKAFIEYLTKRGMLSDPQIDDLLARKRAKSKMQKAYHNTNLLLKKYRDIVWTMETIPSQLKSELDIPFEDLDTLIDRIDIEMSMDNLKMESRLRTIAKSRMLIDRLNEAINILKERPSNGEIIYTVNSRGTMLYVCKNYPRCDSYVRVHPGTTIPMGTVANRKLRALRSEAHRYFNQIYNQGLMTKSEAYEWLSGVLGLPIANTHIGLMGEYYCQIVIEESRKILSTQGKKRALPKEQEGRMQTCS